MFSFFAIVLSALLRFTDSDIFNIFLWLTKKDLCHLYISTNFVIQRELY